jgi:Fibronectin type III domain
MQRDCRAVSIFGERTLLTAAHLAARVLLSLTPVIVAMAPAATTAHAAWTAAPTRVQSAHHSSHTTTTTGSTVFTPNNLFAVAVGPLPITSAAFTTSGGTLMVFASGSGSSPVINNTIGMTVQLDGTSIGTASVPSNEALSHRVFVSSVLLATPAAGSHTITLQARTGTTTDSFDYFSVTTLELPTGTNVAQLFNQSPGPLPLVGAPVTTSGGQVVVFASGSGWALSPAFTKIGMSVLMDGSSVGTSQLFANDPGTHKTLTSNALVVHPAAGSHIFSLANLGATITDGADIFSLTVLELPSGAVAEEPFNQASGPLPLPLVGTSVGGTVLAFASGSSTATGGYAFNLMSVGATTDSAGDNVGRLGILAGYDTEINNHHAMVPSVAVAGICPGTSVRFVNLNNSDMRNDSNDFFSLTLLQIPVQATPPSSPTNVTASIANGSTTANVTWVAPTDLGGTVLDCYFISTSPPDVPTIRVAPRGNVPIGGLRYGTTYTFTIQAVNAAGTSISATSNAITPIHVPDVPTGVVAYAENASAVIDWTAPAAYGCPIDQYVITTGTTNKTLAVGPTTPTSYLFSGLTNGQSYTFTVKAHNCAGFGPISGPSNAVIPAAVPPQPPMPTAQAGNAAVTLYFRYPSDSATTITATSTPGNVTATITGSTGCCSLTVGPLINGQAYTFTVVARNSVGSSAVSPPSNSVHAGAPDISGISGLPGESEVFLRVSTVANGGPVTKITVSAYLGNSTTPVVQVFTGNPLPPTLVFTGSTLFPSLTNGGNYRFIATATNLYGDSAPSLETGYIVPELTVAILPVVMNGAYGGYVSAITLMNTGNAATGYTIVYFDQSGAVVGSGNEPQVAVNGSVTIRQDSGSSFPSSGGDAVQAGSAIIFGNQPVSAFVNEFAPGGGDGSSYSAIGRSGAQARVYAPAIFNNAYGGYNTGIGLVNVGPRAVTVTVTYADEHGTVVATQVETAVPPQGYRGLYSADPVLGLPDGFHGSATISEAYGVAVTVNETGPGGQFSSYDAVAFPAQTVQAPVAINNAFGGYYTGIGLQNTTANAGTVMVTYNDSNGVAVKSVTGQVIAPNGFLGIYQGDATLGPPPGAYSATITVTSGTIALAAIVNEVAPVTGTAQQLTTYNAFGSGAPTSNLALVESAGPDGWSTGMGIMNTGTATTTVTVTYYDTAAGTPVGTAQTMVLAANAFWGVFQPTAGLPAGSVATAVVATSTGGQVAVICNESNAGTFMSYDGQ